MLKNNEEMITDKQILAVLKKLMSEYKFIEISFDDI